MIKGIATNDFVCTNCEKEKSRGEIIYTHWAGDGSLCKTCGEKLMTPTPNNKKTLAEEFEENVEKVEVILMNSTPLDNSFEWREEVARKIVSILTTAKATIEKRVREETLKEVEEWAEETLKLKDNHPEPDEVVWIISDLLSFLTKENK